MPIMSNSYGLNVNSDLLRTFSVVADTGNVSRAAETLGRTQSAISLQIRKLEERLSVVLFERSTRGVVLTDAGRRLLPAANRTIREIERVEALFVEPLTGRVRIGIPDDYNETILERVLARFVERHDFVEVFVRAGCTKGFVQAIANDELDLAVYSAGRVEGVEPFLVEPTRWVAASHFEPPTDAPLPLAMFDRDCWWRDVAGDALDAVGRAWRVAYTSENYASVKAAITAGLAVGIVAESAIGAGMRTLGEKDGFPALPPTSLTLLTGARAGSGPVIAMEEAIRAAIAR